MESYRLEFAFKKSAHTIAFAYGLGVKINLFKKTENDGLVVSVLLEEVKNPIRYFTTIGRYKESSFRIDRFREIETAVMELQTEIEMAA